MDTREIDLKEFDRYRLTQPEIVQLYGSLNGNGALPSSRLSAEARERLHLYAWALAYKAVVVWSSQRARRMNIDGRDVAQELYTRCARISIDHYDPRKGRKFDGYITNAYLLSVGKIAKTLSGDKVKRCSLNQKIGYGMDFEDILIDAAHEKRRELEEIVEEVQRRTEMLDVDKKIVLQRRFFGGEQENFEKIGTEIGKSREIARKRYKRALDLMREYIMI